MAATVTRRAVPVRGRRTVGDNRTRGGVGLRPLTGTARLGFAVLAAGLLMHGCHGPDDDHEPAFAPHRREVSP